MSQHPELCLHRQDGLAAVLLVVVADDELVYVVVLLLQVAVVVSLLEAPLPWDSQGHGLAHVLVVGDDGGVCVDP